VSIVKDKPIYEEISKSYKKEADAIEEMVSTDLITPNMGRTFKKNLKAKYREILENIKGSKTQEEVSKNFDSQKILYEDVEYFSNFWRERGRKYALKMLLEFYSIEPDGHKCRAMVWKKVVEQMSSRGHTLRTPRSPRRVTR
jgi:5'-deoxynucleotidase YfbR-like HD superfamily hydrolase